jgi:Fe-S cluster biogenesis protein NfuA
MDEPATIARVEALLGEVDALPDADARATATALAQALLDLHAEGIGRLIGHVSDQAELAAAVADDAVVAQMLLLHGLHPVALEERVRGALADVRPYLEQHGGNVDFVGVEEGVVQLRLEGSCSGCPSSRVTLEHAIEAAIYEAAPDVAGIRAEDAPAAPGLIQLEIATPLQCPVPAR